MGLPYNELYEPTAHFKQRLNERFNVNEWKPFMKSCYNKMYKDEKRSELATKPTTAWLLNQPLVYNDQIYHPVILLDEKAHKLLTIYPDVDEMEKYIEEHLNHDISDVSLDDYTINFDESTNQDYPDSITAAELDDIDDTPSELEAFALQLHKEQDDFRKKCEYKYAQKVLQQNQEPFEAFIHCYHRILTGNATQQNQQLMADFKALIKPINTIIQNLELK